MLFPLSSSFSGTQLFQRGGEHYEAIPTRKWNIDHTGSADRVAELHNLLVSKKPYQLHVDMCNARAEKGRKVDAGNARAHSETIRSMNAKADEAADLERKATGRRIWELNRRRAASDAGLVQRLTDQKNEYRTFQKDMDERVKSMPYLWGGPSPREDPERTKMRSDNRRSASQNAKDYFKEQAELKLKLSKRPLDWAGNKPPDQHELIEQRKAIIASQLNQQCKEYVTSVEGFYDTHHKRIRDSFRSQQVDHQANCEKKAMHRTMASTAHSDSLRSAKDELAQMKDRVQTRPKGGMAGYTPVMKSELRFRKEAVHADLSSSVSAFGGTRSGALPAAEQRTLSPRALAAQKK